MSFDIKTLEKIADLSKLNISGEQAEHAAQDIDKILKLVAKMNTANTENIEPLLNPMDQYQPMRTDQVTEHNQRELFQRIAPKTYAGLYIVPKVIDQE